MNNDGLIQIDPTLCTGCRQCAKICPVQAITGDFRKPQAIDSNRCVACGQCVQICNAFDSQFDKPWSGREERIRQRGVSGTSAEPFFAAWDRNALARIKDAFLTRKLQMVVHCEEATLISVSEEFGMPAGTIQAGQVVSALHKLGFGHVYSNSLATGFAILEQGHELSARAKNDTGFPVIDTYCPAVTRFIEQTYPDLIPCLSGCRSPRQIAGSLTKACLAQQFKVDASSLFSVSLTPCTAHKLEASELPGNRDRDVDAVLTVRELARLLKQEKIDPSGLPCSEFDRELSPIEDLQGITGHAGAMARAVLETMTAFAGEEQTAVEHNTVEGSYCVSVRVGEKDYTAASVCGLQEAVPFLEDARQGKSNFRFLELRACPQGCVSGGGQPKVLLSKNKVSVYSERGNAMPCASAFRGAQLKEHPALQGFYQDFFHTSCGDQSNQVLQTRYVERTLDKPSETHDLPDRSQKSAAAGSLFVESSIERQ